jgi:hypothetical protein
MPRLAILAMMLLALSASKTFAVSDAVKQGCSADYASYCSKYKVGTAELKSCMRAHRHMLTAACIHALGNSDEVTAEDIRQYKQETRSR